MLSMVLVLNKKIVHNSLCRIYPNEHILSYTHLLCL